MHIHDLAPSARVSKEIERKIEKRERWRQRQGHRERGT